MSSGPLNTQPQAGANTPQPMAAGPVGGLPMPMNNSGQPQPSNAMSNWLGNFFQFMPGQIANSGSFNNFGIGTGSSISPTFGSK